MPRTADAAAYKVFETLSNGDFETFMNDYSEPGAREVYERVFSDPTKSNYITGLQIVSIGTPTNSYSPNSWWVPYKIRFKGGEEKELSLHMEWDPSAQRWYMKGGF